jgi:hypothetical protein
MQDQIETHAGLNGSGGRREPMPTTAVINGGEEGEAPVNATAPPRYRLVALMRDPALRAELKRRVTETDDTYKSMGDWLGVSPGAVQSHAKRMAWPRPPTARGGHAAPAIEIATIDQTAQLVRARLLQAVIRQVEKVDGRLRKKGTEVDEKDSRILGNLAKTLATLMQMGACGKTSNDAEPADRGDVDERLAERVKRWARGEQGY